jgi:hypothetical protein
LLIHHVVTMHSRTAPAVSTAYGALALSIALLITSGAQAAPPCGGRGSSCPVALNSDTARGVALATGQRASAMSTSALAYNPAALVLGKLYHLEGSVDYIPAFNTVALGAAVVDSSTSKVGAGLAFRGFIPGEEGAGGIDVHGALALPIADPLSVGIGLRYVNLTHEETLASGVSRDATMVEGFTMDASIRIQPAPMIQLAAVAVNFIDRESAYAPVLLGGAAALSIAGIVNLGADLLFDISSFNETGVIFGASTEVLIAQIVPLRIGYGFDAERELHTLSGGAGYTDRTVGVDFSIQQELSEGHDDTRVMGAFRYYVH